MTATHCPVCGVAMECGAKDPAGCWCMKLPPTPKEALSGGTTCLCSRCLEQRKLDYARAASGV